MKSVELSASDDATNALHDLIVVGVHIRALLGQVLKLKKVVEERRAREKEQGKIVGAVDFAKAEKNKVEREKEEVDQITTELKLEVEALKSVLKTNNKTIEDLRAESADNYVNGYEDLREPAAKKYLELEFDYFNPPLSLKTTIEFEKVTIECDPKESTLGTELPICHSLML
ncbi:unnamed protein product [Ilex paraguariensis]|uniref:Uncharacterized protein n=1 Tax=Ilex paraguariensis TaxID=185542 RepID=A0ABC8QLJ1_9AQUA